MTKEKLSIRISKLQFCVINTSQTNLSISSCRNSHSSTKISKNSHLQAISGSLGHKRNAWLGPPQTYAYYTGDRKA